jgi:hypothetical protein
LIEGGWERDHVGRGVCDVGERIADRFARIGNQKEPKTMHNGERERNVIKKVFCFLLLAR